jgi:hypothetical protein
MLKKREDSLATVSSLLILLKIQELKSLVASIFHDKQHMYDIQPILKYL